MTFIYLMIAVIWGVFRTDKVYQENKEEGELLSTCIVVFILNVLLFPMCLFFSIKNKKL